MTRARRLAWMIVAGLVLVVAGVGAYAGFGHTAPKGVPPELVPASWEEFRESPGHLSHVASGKADCKDCHDYERAGFKNPGEAPCARCHDTQASHLHPDKGDAKKIGCLECHSFSPSKSDTKCMDCHEKPQGPLAAVHDHATTNCADCHTMHAETFTASAACSTCHDERATEHGRHAGSQGCSDCHAPHASALAAGATCSQCHAQPAGPKPAGHDSCQSCHRPHDFIAGGARASSTGAFLTSELVRATACIGCHGPKATIAAALTTAHSDCTGCHTPHAPAEATASCSRCHADKHVVHGTLAAACVGCHVPHGDPETKAGACTNCHTTVAVTDNGAHAGGIRCESCHPAHDVTPTPKPALCTQCHAHEATLASTNRGHVDCATCHGDRTHEPARAPPCGTCHAKEQATAPTGHQGCQKCHEPHAGDPGPQAACTACHAQRASGPHQGVPGGCETCHRPHGPNGVAAPPPCSSCHARPTLPALHAIAQHGDCATCHTSHGPPRSDRATCTSGCHTDRRDHQPGAEACAGCHVFRK